MMKYKKVEVVLFYSASYLTISPSTTLTRFQICVTNVAETES